MSAGKGWMGLKLTLFCLLNEFIMALFILATKVFVLIFILFVRHCEFKPTTSLNEFLHIFT